MFLNNILPAVFLSTLSGNSWSVLEWTIPLPLPLHNQIKLHDSNMQY